MFRYINLVSVMAIPVNVYAVIIHFNGNEYFPVVRENMFNNSNQKG